ncbi:RagB/SusD family nutrient uptake outer membrane protein [Spirosoma endbachense]|uniref:RagB/SusD family nutrient uptake outer membrane protein n=1 Tax=Spirosoma endbachense TaxID=2666025 RepID=A0A6P1VXW4_9BACT|nr:RagB/SusD family nutrient uptake outer membrane protein [Spirosoma endbachense]QHV97158.1 RagB/SusD family nutrient uptake outer membrane protein [Spirosoma endbachense]
MNTNYIKAGLLALSILVLSGCQTDLLLQPPNDRLSTDLFWKTENDAVLAVNAAYPAVLDDGAALFQRDAFSDIAHVNLFFNADALVEKNSYDASNSVIATQWSTLWAGVTKTNFVLDNVDAIPVTNKTVVNRVKGEAKALRAYQYIKLTALFGDVPLITKVISIEDGKGLSRTPISQIWDFIDKELTEAASLLPVSYTGTDIGRVTKGAALAMKARANLYAGRYQQAAADAKAVMESGIYSIYPKFADLFGYAGERSPEVILDREYVKDVLPSPVFNQMAPYGQTSALASNSYVPTKALAIMYSMANGKLINDPTSGFDPKNPYQNRDPRLGFTVYVPGDLLPNGKVFNSLPSSNTPDAVGGTFYATATGFTSRKYVNNADAATPTNSGINIIQVRYAEVLLTYAEAKIEQNQIDQSVLDAINAVRARGDVKLPAITLPQSQADLRELVRRERTIELAFEGLRLYDLRRWKIGDKVLVGSIGGIDYVDNNAVKTIEVPSFIKSFNTTRDYLWPIPTNERILSPNLTQNTGW